MQKEFIGVDIGGTNMKAGKVVNGSVLQSHLVEVDRNDTEEATLDKLFEIINKVMTDSVEAIGIGVPAVVDPESGIVYDVQNIPAWTKVALKDLVYQKYKVPVFINNDANCFALGEKYFGKAQAYTNCVALSLGTGLGMGILIDNKLYNGVLCGAGEIGMLPYKNGIMEHYTGSFFFEETYGESAKALFNKALEEDTVALGAFNEYGKHLGEAIKAILYLFAPEMIVLGGSISNAYPFFKDAVMHSLGSFAYQKQLEHFKIETSDLVDSPILGAAALCL
ncbi:ROK family protein [Allomuricauda taeanensis]|jgi:glucokinase|uniref:ROK family protein n=1 Tax=Flavobacteriaceae TaxID=49546 RepID=UPI0023494FC0|nr:MULTISPECIES: ROK family protein [Allomuricauda]MDC6386571.1 ROK family protein [Muricauda sp. SK9]MEE1964165.1 ROK family protein [Allomuricauda taeanensis]